MLLSKGMVFPTSSGANGLVLRGQDSITVEAVGDLEFEKLEVESPARMGGGSYVHLAEMGAFSYFCNNSYIRNVTKIGRFVSISADFIAGLPQHATKLITSSEFITCSAKETWYSSFFNNVDNIEWIKGNMRYYKEYEEKKKGITIGNDIWIGERVTVSDGIAIGDGAIIGTGSIVTKDVEPYSVVAGVPAREIRKRFSEDIIEQLLELKWWDYGPNILIGLNPDIKIAVKELKEKISAIGDKWSPDIIEFSHKKQEIYMKSKDKKTLLYKL